MSVDAVPDTGIRLDGRVVVLTGASSGLGWQLAEALDRAGAQLVLVARRSERLDQLASALAGDPLLCPADVTSEQAVEEVVERAAERFGTIHGLVNNAGVTNVTPALRETTDDFRRVLEVNLVAPFVMSRAVARRMRETGGGAIVNVASVLSLVSLRPLPEASYAASKAGLLGLTRELATQWARYDIRVNAIGPGGFSTEMSSDVYEPHGTLGWFMRDRVPLERAGRPGELDAIVTVLLHPATAYVTGQMIAIDGGLTAS